MGIVLFIINAKILGFIYIIFGLICICFAMYFDKLSKLDLEELNDDNIEKNSNQIEINNKLLDLDEVPEKKSDFKITTVATLIVCFIFFSGFKTEKTMLTGTIIGSNIYRDWVIYGKYKRTYYDIYILIEDNGSRKITIENHNIAKNILSYWGDEVKIEKETKYWYGKLWTNYYTIK